jgi:hypothetical protein
VELAVGRIGISIAARKVRWAAGAIPGRAGARTPLTPAPNRLADKGCGGGSSRARDAALTHGHAEVPRPPGTAMGVDAAYADGTGLARRRGRGFS